MTVPEALSARMALTVIAARAGGYCAASFHRPLGHCITSRERAIHARDGADLACDPCVAWLGLQTEDE